jgi:chaperonin GroES
MTFRPTADRVLVELDNPETKTASGFIIPDALVEKPHTGTVVASGPGRTTSNGTLVPINVAVGDSIMFEQGSGVPVRVNRQDLLVVREDSIIALVEPKSL